jgi:dynein heavy chain
MWSKYKIDNFWEINISEMEVTIQSIFKELNSSIRLLKDENWIILNVAKNDIEKFRRVLPLINDLRNTAMYTRHWDEVREVVKVYVL